MAVRFGTPLYVVDEQSFVDRIHAYKSAFHSAYENSEISFASKANSAPALLKIAHREGATIDVASEGEFRAALLAGVPPENCHLHGNNKTREELKFALDQGISHIVIDHFGEIEMVSELRGDSKTRFILRLAPGVDPKTHARISTGQADTKFGFNIADGSAEKALVRCLELGLPVDGVHCHVGSQLTDPEAQRSAGEFLAEFAVEMKLKHGYETQYLNIGGGLAARYTDKDNPMAIAQYNQLIVDSILPVLQRAGLNPKLAQEPGRSLIAEAGVTLYTVGVIKTVPIKDGMTRTFVAVDGGLSDNPRPAMYEAVYDLELIRQKTDWEYVTDGPGAVAGRIGEFDEPGVFTVSGKHCETDTLFKDITLSGEPKPGDLIQVFTTGAYNASMASNYNRYPRPATVLITKSGKPVLITRRDTYEEMFAREFVPEDL